MFNVVRRRGRCQGIHCKTQSQLPFACWGSAFLGIQPSSGQVNDTLQKPRLDLVGKMLINRGTAISTSKILLVPYEALHVPTYHEWMKDEKIQAETASEPLTLEEEYAMQRSWRTDVDKLTFIACLPLPLPDEAPRIITPGIADSPTRMIGDVNLFLTPSDAPPSSPTSSSASSVPSHSIIGELELMIAPSQFRRQGHGRGAILAFLSYISNHLPSILLEFGRGQEPGVGDMRLEGLRVKIGKENEGSLGLFRSLGFEFKEGEEGPNYFGEVELWFNARLEKVHEDGMKKLREQWGVEKYEELGYGEEGGIPV